MPTLRSAFDFAGLLGGATGLAVTDMGIEGPGGLVILSLGAISFTLVLINQLGVAYDRFVKPKPPFQELIDELENDFGKRLQEMIDAVSSDAEGGDSALETAIRDLKADLIERMQRIENDLTKAAGSRKGMHAQLDKLNARLSAVESTVDAMKGASSLQELAKVIKQ